MRRCLQNLIDNAIIYGGEAEVIVSNDRRALQIRISDKGPGIPDATTLKRVFEPYLRGPAARNALAGTGLGLTIARSVAQAHGGTIVIANGAITGSDVTLDLPREH